MFTGVFVVLLVPLAAAGCHSSEQLDPEVEQLGRATGPAGSAESTGGMGPMGAMGGAGERQGDARGGGEGAVLTGKIVETMQVPNYTYMLLDVGKGEPVWTAVNSAEVEVGQQVTVVESLTMRDFTSRTLNRTFESIVFGTMRGAAAAVAPQDGGLPPGHPPIDGKPPGHPPVEAQPEPPAN